MEINIKELNDNLNKPSININDDISKKKKIMKKKVKRPDGKFWNIEFSDDHISKKFALSRRKRHKVTEIIVQVLKDATKINKPLSINEIVEAVNNRLKNIGIDKTISYMNVYIPLYNIYKNYLNNKPNIGISGHPVPTKKIVNDKNGISYEVLAFLWSQTF
jgi:hypothetical protein